FGPARLSSRRCSSEDLSELRRRAPPMTHGLTMLWRFRRSAECRAAWSLLGRGFLWRREPSFVREGKKPDFFAFGRGRLWVEVKSFDPPASQTLLSLAWSDLQRRLRNAHR